MELSKRLMAVTSLVTPGNTIVDIGTDHAYIPIYLMEKKSCISAIAMDVNEGPLERAKEHIKELGFEEQIETRRSDGFEKLKIGEADTAIIAGMGGGLVMKILTDVPEVTCSLKECILQPQSEIAKVRCFLLQHGFTFVEENMVLDEGKYYPMMKVIPPETMEEKKICFWTETELRFGKLLLEKKDPVLLEFLQRELRIHQEILDSLQERTGGKIEQRKAELCEDLLQIQKGLEYYEV